MFFFQTQKVQLAQQMKENSCGEIKSDKGDRLDLPISQKQQSFLEKAKPGPPQIFS